MTLKTFMAGAATVNITANGTSQPLAVNPNANAVRIMNTGPGIAFLHFGDASLSASLASSMPIASGATETFTKGSASYLHVISDSTAKIYVTAGEGL